MSLLWEIARKWHRVGLMLSAMECNTEPADMDSWRDADKTTGGGSPRGCIGHWFRSRDLPLAKITEIKPYGGFY